MIEILCVDGIVREFQQRRNRKGYFHCCENCSLFIFYPMKLEDHTCTITGKTTNKKGKDHWGYLFDFSHHEERGHCFWCGAELFKSNKRYCNSGCRQEYLNHFLWSFARKWCLVRYHNTCQGCGSQKDLDVHHIIPVPNSRYGWDILNRPENLIPLCKKCHGKVRNKLIPVEIQHEKRQLALF